MEMRISKTLIVAAAMASAYAQSPAFEVASIKPSPPDAGSTVSSGGGPGTRDPGTWRCESMTLRNIVFIAFNVRSNQLVAPGWMNEPRFDITAKVPKGATREQVYRMLQNLLIERFGLKFHQEQKEVQGYQLVVAKNGPKFRESAPEPPKDASNPEAPAPRPAAPTLGSDGFPTVVPGVSSLTIIADHARGQWVRAPIQRLAANVERQLGAPVIDATGLKGQYDLSLAL
jgi:uncharacterized protein (TIGR03435 family)